MKLWNHWVLKDFVVKIYFLTWLGMIKCCFFSRFVKSTFWKTWQNYPQLTKSLVKLCNNSTAEVLESEMNTNERFVCSMYHAASTKYVVNKCRRQLLAQCNRQLQNLPPTQDSSKEHVCRIMYQAVFVWAQSLIPMQKPSKSRWVGIE